MGRLESALTISAAIAAGWGIASGAAGTPAVQMGAEYLEPVVPHVFEGDLRDLPRAPEWQPGDAIKEIPKRRRPPAGAVPGIPPTAFPDPLLEIQREADEGLPDRSLGAPLLNFPGQGFTGVNPPDTVGDVGSDHYVQMVNSAAGTRLVVYNKAGAAVAGPLTLDSLGFGDCAFGLGDPIVLYDEMADRWLLSEFSSTANRLCVYVSQSSDPVSGGWFVYAFPTPNFPDYPKYSVWPDAYYVTSNESLPALYALERSKMLTGQGAGMQRFTAPPLGGFGFQALTPADVDGPAPPAGTPGIFMRHRDDEAHDARNSDPSKDFLDLFELEADFAVPGNSTLTGPTVIEVSEFDSSLCGLFSFNCFPQPGSRTTLDPLREIVMWRLQYRNFGAYQTLVGNFVTDVDGADTGGIRWYELRDGGAGWALEQEGTYSPDATNRWMGAIAMDASGNIAVGYNVTDAGTVYPGLRYAGRTAGDASGALPQGETVVVSGATANASNRYGDYSALSVDPKDGCTFWLTGEYNSSSTWSTRIAAFKFDDCQPPAPPPFDHFLCYDIRAPSVDDLAVSLSDQFDQPGESRTYDLRRSRRLCTPASKNGSGIRDESIHLQAYPIRLSKTEPQGKHESRKLRVANQFGEVTLETVREEWLMVPSLKDPNGGIPPAPDPFGHVVDHFKCYKVKKVSGFEAAAGTLTDQFVSAKAFEIRKPTRICNPADKNEEGLFNPENHLLCYPLKVKPKLKVDDIGVNNQLGPSVVDIKGEKELCVPSEKELLDLE